jgi:hypothetical protein
LGILILWIEALLMQRLSICLLAFFLLASSVAVFAEANTQTQQTNTENASSTTSNTVFKQNFELHGIGFQVTSQGNKLRIIPSGLKLDNSPIERDIHGVVTGADIGDINVDGSPEIYVYIKAKEKGELIAYSANHNKSLSDIYLPPITDNPKLSKGYRGHDEFMLIENIIAQRFPIYKDNDSDDKPTGGWRQLQYKLVPGEANWQLKLDQTIDY